MIVVLIDHAVNHHSMDRSQIGNEFIRIPTSSGAEEDLILAVLRPRSLEESSVMTS